MVPKVNFKWSFIYQQLIHSSNVKSEEFDIFEYEKYVKDFILSIEESWRKIEPSIFRYCEEISGLKWKKSEIDCYVIKISSYHPFSDPLTIPINLESDGEVYPLTKERYIDFLIHELLHNLFIQNDEETWEYFNHIFNEYSKEEFDTVIHIPIHMLHKKIFIKFFNENRLIEEIKLSNYYPSYKRSWEIVNEKGEDNLIKEFKNHLISN